ncbi:hypothetical protein Taro_038791 [Colocasia esculenta]|uniref:Tetratricopeptide repeat protein 38 n=1 Tax=Colocasia esculenta TaxID=4460 RepID=A0A843WDU8_COLES|nr:hypothetical protein [Colocasia esculenta]
MEEAARTRTDQWGNLVRTTSDACVAAINSYYHQVLSYGRDRKVILEASKRDPDCVLANVLAAHFVASKKPSAAVGYLTAAASRLESATAYEKAVFRAVSYLLEDDRNDEVAVQVHRELLKEFPKDLISLKRVQVLCFYIGRPDISLELVEQVLPENQEEAYIYGMLAFPLLELGRTCDAEKSSLKGLEINKNDVWSQHAVSQWCSCSEVACLHNMLITCYSVLCTSICPFTLFVKFCNSEFYICSRIVTTFSIWFGTIMFLWISLQLCHVLQNDCRFNEAVDFMEACSSSWTVCSSFMYTHNWWHVAVCYLEGHSPLEKVLEIYDHYIWKELEREGADCEEVYLNALGLLLRISVRRQMDSIGDRLKVVADIFTNESNWHAEWLGDLLALWALAMTEKVNKAEELLKSLKRRVCSMSKKKQCTVQRGIVERVKLCLFSCQLAEALLEYGRGSYYKVFEILGPNFDAIEFKMIGASDEQLDVFNEVWYDTLLSTGHAQEAIEAMEKRVGEREGAPFLWHLLARAYSLGGRPDASFASDKSRALEVAYFK